MPRLKADVDRLRQGLREASQGIPGLTEEGAVQRTGKGDGPQPIGWLGRALPRPLGK